MPLLCTTTALACFYSATLAWNATAVDTRGGSRDHRRGPRPHLAAAARPHQPIRAISLRPGTDAACLTRVFRPMRSRPLSRIGAERADRSHRPLEHGLSRPRRPASPRPRHACAGRAASPCRPARLGAHRADRRLCLDQRQSGRQLPPAPRCSLPVPDPGRLTCSFEQIVRRPLLARKPRKLAAVALANKIARTVWAMMARGEAYRHLPDAA